MCKALSGLPFPQKAALREPSRVPASSSQRLDREGDGDAIPIENPDGPLPPRPLARVHGSRLLLLVLDEFVHPRLMHKIPTVSTGTASS